MKTKKFGFPHFKVWLLLVILSGFFSCEDTSDSNKLIWPDGDYTKSEIQKLTGFSEQKAALLATANLSETEFIAFSTDSAWHLSNSDRTRLKLLRNAVSTPAPSTLMQKVIPLQDVATYMNNTYNGTIGGFVCKAADIKSLATMSDIYDGLRLDYTGTKFLRNGAGYAVIRFTSNYTDKIYIPYCTEMGGTTTHAWPSTGGGFTSSTLGNGGFPEYTFSNYYAPNQGGELYEVTPLGNEILRATFEGTQWVTTEPTTRNASARENTIRNGLYGQSGGHFYPILSYNGGSSGIQTDSGLSDYSGLRFYVATYAGYQNFTVRVWEYDQQHYWITTSDEKAFGQFGFEVVEKCIYGKIVAINEINNLREEIKQQ